MNFELWIAFIVASTILNLIPGPSVLLITARAMTQGTRAALTCIVGTIIAGVVLMVVSLLGVGAILETSPLLFQIIKWAGVIYMIYLGVSQIIETRNSKSTPVENKQNIAKDNLRDGFLSVALNPKSLAFYFAFLTQFIDPTSDLLVQFSILITTSSVIGGVFLLGYLLLAARTRQMFQSNSAVKSFGYAGGSFMVVAGVLLASTK